MVRLLLIEDRPGLFEALRAEGVALAPAHDQRAGLAFARLAGPGIVTVDVALPGHDGYRCVNALSGGASEIPVLALVGCDHSIHETALGARLRAFVRRDRAVHLGSIAGWPSTLGLSSREFDRLMAIIRRCGRFTMEPERRYLLDVRTVGFLVPFGATLDSQATYSDAWHATQFAIARDAHREHRAIA